MYNSQMVFVLQDLNALPFAAMAINCAAWVFYAMLLEDYYIYFGNLPGMLLGMFYVLTCYKFSKEAVRGRFAVQQNQHASRMYSQGLQRQRLGVSTELQFYRRQDGCPVLCARTTCCCPCSTSSSTLRPAFCG